MPLDLGLSDIFSCQDSGYAFGATQSQMMVCPSQRAIPGGSLSSLCLIPGGISLNHLFKEVSAGFLLCKVVVFPFLVDKHLGGDAFRPCKCPVSPPTFTC